MCDCRSSTERRVSEEGEGKRRKEVEVENRMKASRTKGRLSRSLFKWTFLVLLQNGGRFGLKTMIGTEQLEKTHLENRNDDGKRNESAKRLSLPIPLDCSFAGFRSLYPFLS